MTTTAFTAMIALAATPIAYMDVVVAWSAIAPRALPIREKRPPAPMTVPPMTTARIASSSV